MNAFQVIEKSGSALIPEFLSPRQRDIAELRAQGLSDKAIARRLGIAASTLAGHVHRMNVKLRERGYVWGYMIFANPLSADSTSSRVAN